MKTAHLLSEPSSKSLSRNGIDTKRIKRGDIAATLKYVSKHIGIPTKHLHKLGSTGKLDTCGDIDIAIDCNEYDPDLIHNRLRKLCGQDNYKRHNSVGVTSYAVPIRGEDKRGLVQLDVMFTTNVEWAKFSYHSEGENSRYKGAVRAILMAAVANSLNKSGMDHIEYDSDDNEVTIQVGRKVDMTRGMIRRFGHRPMRKDNTSRVKNMQSIPIEKFKELYPDVNVSGGQIVVDDPAKVVKLLFGSGVGVDDVNTAEKILQLIHKKFDDQTQNAIFDHAAKHSTRHYRKMRLPREIEQRLDNL
jgi:hypothetical protein